ncbi:RNA-binding cell elongation regulator Jag/EloR [Kurthia sibirica]|uniref:RNA-binding protein KhpB n=1 Tax=Kurthia sibirica TaxID=202750 RepID=A0A2U3AMH7_9BACL|nr:RNA-binding cell elongation regulator Jag/EloR [Kurthia sibirica]PWI25738.1 protein jag [Kurthia sibirica]GEK35074.1 RNA-binding protein [Kurthia sibirica]
MKQSTQVGATVEEAVVNALKKLELTREQVEIDVLQQPKKGFLGIGSRDAHVLVREILANPVTQSVEQVAIQEQVIVTEPEVINEEAANVTAELVTKKDDSLAIEAVAQYIRDIVLQMGIDDLQLEQTQKQKVVQFQLSTKKAALLIGKRGQTLNSLQLLAQLIAQNNSQRYLTVEVDVENYRQKREDALVELAHRLADRAATSGKRFELEPMLSNERKIIHNALADRLDVDTFSEGDANKRYLVIEPVR